MRSLRKDTPSESPNPSQDISEQVLSAITPEMSYTERTKAIEQRQKESRESCRGQSMLANALKSPRCLRVRLMCCFFTRISKTC